MRYRISLLFTLILCAVHALGSLENDPLKPVWDGIELLPAKILNDMQEILKSQVAFVNHDIDWKVERFKSNLKTAVKSQVDEGPAVTEAETNLKDLMTNSLTEAFENLYKNTMKPEYAAHVDSRNIIMYIEETESKVSRHLDQNLRKTDFLINFNGTLEDHVYEISHYQQTIADVVSALDGKVSSVQDTLAGGKSAVDVCSAKLEDLQQFIRDDRPSKQRLAEFEREWDNTYQAVAGDLPRVFFHRDCSEILQSNKEATSGVYTVYPSRDLEEGVKVWCDMETVVGDANSESGWTVMLRRRNTSVGLTNFNRSWTQYAEGFGDPGDEGEWWLGLTWVHELTYHQPYQLLFLLHDIERGDFKAHYSNFRVEAESRDFRLVVDGFTSSLEDAFGDIHHGEPFSTPDRDNDKCDACNCAVNNQGGWWFKVCHRTVLTAPFPTSNDREAKTIRWLSGTWLVFDDVTMMIKPNAPK